jgi:hypothetical protein
MRPLPKPSVSPLPASASRPFASRPVTIVEALKVIIAWLRGRKPTFREQMLEAKLVERLAEEIEEQETPAPQKRSKRVPSA